MNARNSTGPHERVGLTLHSMKI